MEVIIKDKDEKEAKFIINSDVVTLDELLEAFEGLLYCMGYRFSGHLDFIEEDTMGYKELRDYYRKLIEDDNEEEDSSRD